MNNKSLTDMMEAAMYNLQPRKMTRAALAAVLMLGTASVAAADAPATEKKTDPAIAELAAKESITREKNEKDAEALFKAGIQLRDKEMKYEQAVEKFLAAKKIWEGNLSVEPAKYTRNIEEVKKHIYQAYYDWAKELSVMAEKDASVNKLDDAIAKCRQAAEMYDPCKAMMDDAIAKYEKKKRAMEFASATTLAAADPATEERAENIELSLQRGRAYYKIGRWDDARAQFNAALAQDPYNGVAIEYIRKIYEKMIDAGKSRKDLQAAEMTNEAAWKLVAPVLVSSVADDDSDLGSGPVAKADKAKTLRSKLQQIKFKTLVFEETPLDEVVKYLKRRSKEADEDKVGVNFVLRCNEGSAESSGSDEDYEEEDAEETESAPSGEMPLITIYFGAEDEGEDGAAPEITLEKVIKAICDSAGLKHRVEEHAVVIATSDVSLEDFVTEFYAVEKEAVDAAGADDIQAYFESRGVKFDEGASAIFDDQTNKLIVTNTPQMQEEIQRLVTTLNRSDPQIQVQVKFVEISMNDMEELGFEYTVSRDDIVSANDKNLASSLTQIAWNDVNWTLQPGQTDAFGNTEVTAVGGYWKNDTGTPVTIYQSGTDKITGSDGTYAYADKYTGGGTTFDPKETQDGKIYLPDQTYWKGTVDANGNINITQPGTVLENNFYYRQAPEYVRRGRHSVTFDANEQVVRSAKSDPLAFGSENGEPVADTVFNWTRYSSSGFQYNAQIHALDQADSADTLSSPRVTTMNSQTATIKMVERVYYPESWGDAELNNVNGMIIFTPSTPEFGDEVELGVQLEVTPEIADDEKYTLLMQMNPVILDFIGWTDYSYTIIPDPDQPGVLNTLKMPIIEARAVQTNVVCYDRSTIVLGGIVKDRVSSVDDQYPILGDIPIVGRLFQSKGKGSQKTNLLIFLTASLVNSDGSYYRDSIARGVPQF